MAEQRKLIAWVKAHKKALKIAGFSIAALIAAILLFKNRAAIKACWDTLKKAIAQPGPTPKVPVTKAPPQQIIHIPVEEAKPVVQLVTPMADVAPAITRQPYLVPFEVDPHIRELHPGWQASAEKIATALEHGFVLKEGQTWVTGYVKGGTAA